MSKLKLFATVRNDNDEYCPDIKVFIYEEIDISEVKWSSPILCVEFCLDVDRCFSEGWSVNFAPISVPQQRRRLTTYLKFAAKVVLTEYAYLSKEFLTEVEKASESKTETFAGYFPTIPLSYHV